MNELPQYVHDIAEMRGCTLEEAVWHATRSSVLHAKVAVERTDQTILDFLKGGDELDRSLTEEDVIAILVGEAEEDARVAAMDTDQYLDYLQDYDADPDAPVRQRPNQT